ncbi:5-oxoprolinase subunit B family protein [Roseinatronobacter monicus]|uniref:5-oxoprolinase subunit B family protein n=1 Tax=Roseinatronobacter monicus TaxID=393481 RepID=UPI003F2A7C4A
MASTHSEAPEPPRISTLGVDGMLVSFGSTLSEAANRAALSFRAAVEAEGLMGVEETATSLTSAYLRLDLDHADHGSLRAKIETLLGSRDWYAAPLPQGRKLWRVPAVFGTDLAPQLQEAAKLAGLTPDAAITALCAAPLRVQTIGFAPGQPYLGELPPEWDIPRQTGLTARVPEGAVAVAIRQMVLFSVATPTGWRHVGQTALRLFNPDKPDPFILRPGDEVQFQPVTREEFENIRIRDADGGAVSERLG